MTALLRSFSSVKNCICLHWSFLETLRILLIICFQNIISNHFKKMALHLSFLYPPFPALFLINLQFSPFLNWSLETLTHQGIVHSQEAMIFQHCAFLLLCAFLSSYCTLAGSPGPGFLPFGKRGLLSEWWTSWRSVSAQVPAAPLWPWWCQGFSSTWLEPEEKMQYKHKLGLGNIAILYWYCDRRQDIILDFGYRWIGICHNCCLL